MKLLLRFRPVTPVRIIERDLASGSLNCLLAVGHFLEVFAG